MVELADTPDLGSGAARLGGSSPPSRIADPLLLILLSACATVSSCSFSPEVSPPPSPPVEIEAFTADLNSELLNYIRAENEYTARQLAGMQATKQSILTKLLSTPEPGTSQGIVVGNYHYFSKPEQGWRQPVIYRETLGSPGPAIVFNPNEVLRAYPSAELGLLRIAPGNKLIAFSVDLERRGIFELFLWDIENSRIAQISHEDVQDFAWTGKDCLAFFTVRERLRANTLWQWSCDTAAGTRKLYQSADDLETLDLSSAPLTGEVILSRRRSGLKELYVLNEDARSIPSAPDLRGSPSSKLLLSPRFRVKVSDVVEVSIPNRVSSVLRVPLPGDMQIQDAELKGDSLVMIGRKRLRPALAIYQLGSRSLLAPELPADAESLRLLPASTPNDPLVRMEIESLARHSFIISFNTATRLLDVPAASPGQERRVRVEEALSFDGTNIPISIVSSSAAQGSSPLLLVAYGAYGQVSSRGYLESDSLLLAKGFRIAVAHIRGGGEGGEAWHRQATRLSKRRSFEDLAACARHLVASGYTSPERLFAYGKSAGGLTVAVTAAQNPGLFRAIILDRPLVDLAAAVQDPLSPLYAVEREEWGDTHNPEELANIQSISPVERLREFQYPAMLVITGLRDSVVPYQSVLRWFALMRQRNRQRTGLPTALLYTSMTAQHESELDTVAQAQLEALIDSYLLAQLSGGDS